MSEQLHLFGAPKPKPAVSAAAVSNDVVTLAGRLPASLYLGTSSWSFPGWHGLVYGNQASETKLANEGLAAYAAHPLFRTVGVDRSHYAPLSEAQWQAYASAVPASFRFLVKAHEAVTLLRFPHHPRYGSKRGAPNPLFLDAAYAESAVVGPAMAGLGDKLGLLLFQFAPQDVAALGGALRFAERLAVFLGGLPPGVRYAVEVRNLELLDEAYTAVLLESGALHCHNIWGAMPSVLRQAQLVRSLEADTVVIRWLLPRDLSYEAARARYTPFDRIIDERPTERAAVAALVRQALGLGKSVYVIFNNKAEGSAPLSALALARKLVEPR